jgi:hypothetical protein
VANQDNNQLIKVDPVLTQQRSPGVTPNNATGPPQLVRPAVLNNIEQQKLASQQQILQKNQAQQ